MRNYSFLSVTVFKLRYLKTSEVTASFYILLTVIRGSEELIQHHFAKILQIKKE
jgi:hypothetical protein